MIEIPTVLVLGAGASAEYDFPVGRTFMRSILESINGEIRNFESSLSLKWNIPKAKLEEAYEALRGSPLRSIDEFLENRSDFSDIGKMAIARSLIPLEIPGKLMRAKDERWYEYLFHYIKAKPDKFRENKLFIITFNYDRSLEYFLFNSLVNSYPLSESEAADLLHSIPIVHIYGQLGEPHFWSDKGRKYSQEVTPQAVKICVESIRLIDSERGTDTQEFETARQWIQQKEVQRVCFLGFGYDPANIDRLRIREIYSGIILGSVYKLGLSEKREVMQRLRPNGHNISLHEGDVMSTLKTLPILTDWLEWGFATEDKTRFP